MPFRTGAVIRDEFAKISVNNRLIRKFSEAERVAIDAVSRQSAPVELMR